MRKQNTECIQCNKRFYAQPYRLKKGQAKYCSVECRALYEGTKIPTKYPQNRKCPECKKTFEVRLRYRYRKFCGQTCARFNNKKRQGIKYKKNVEKSTSFRGRLLKKYGHQCVICGYDKFVEAHHIIEQSKNGESSIRNGVLLCPNHHAETHGGMITAKELIWRVADMGLIGLENRASGETLRVRFLYSPFGVVDLKFGEA